MGTTPIQTTTVTQRDGSQAKKPVLIDTTKPNNIKRKWLVVIGKATCSHGAGSFETLSWYTVFPLPFCLRFGNFVYILEMTSSITSEIVSRVKTWSTKM